MTGSLLYTIQSRTGFALAIDGNNYGPGSQLILANSKADDPDQQWSWLYYPQTQASILYNPYRNLYAAPKTLQNDAPVILFSVNPGGFGPDNTWQIVGDNRDVVRTAGNTDLNLNALGNDYHPGLGVGIYTWSRGGGHPNQYWVSALIDAKASGGPAGEPLASQ